MLTRFKSRSTSYLRCLSNLTYLDELGDVSSSDLAFLSSNETSSMCQDLIGLLKLKGNCQNLSRVIYPNSRIALTRGNAIKNFTVNLVASPL